MWALASDSRPPLAGAARLLRVCTVSGTSLTLAASAHVLGGGGAPSPGALLLSATVLLAVAALMTRCRCRFWGLLTAVGLEQALLHMTFTAVNGAGMCLSTVAARGHAHPGMSLACSSGTVPRLGAGAATPFPGAMSAGMPSPGWPMLFAHLAATVALVWLICRGEAWLWRIVARLPGTPGTGPVGAVTHTGWIVVPLLETSKLFSRPAAPRGPPLRPALT